MFFLWVWTVNEGALVVCPNAAVAAAFGKNTCLFFTRVLVLCQHMSFGLVLKIMFSCCLQGGLRALDGEGARTAPKGWTRSKKGPTLLPPLQVNLKLLTSQYNTPALTLGQCMTCVLFHKIYVVFVFAAACAEEYKDDGKGETAACLKCGLKYASRDPRIIGYDECNHTICGSCNASLLETGDASCMICRPSEESDNPDTQIDPDWEDNANKRTYAYHITQRQIYSLYIVGYFCSSWTPF